MYPAKNGDCFLITIGKESHKHILIDCGYADTYDNYLRKDLIELNAAGEKIDLMIITHIDADHILGAIHFIEENNKMGIIHIEEVWFNSYRHLQIDKQASSLSEKEKSILKHEISLGESYLQRAVEKGIEHTEISARQGSTLGALLMQGNYKWNYSFNKQAVSSDNKEKIELGDIAIHIISPNDNKLQKLKNKWIKELRKKKWNFNINKDELFDDAYEFMLLMNEKVTVEHSKISRNAERDDISIDEAAKQEVKILDNAEINGSSIAIMIEYHEKKLLFLADAHPDIICENLKNIGLNDFDLVKLPHHGSRKNMTSELAKMLSSNIYLVSTNGDKHLHPDIESLAKILYFHYKVPKKFYFNYETATSKRLNSEMLCDRYNYHRYTGTGEEAVIIEL